jgi:hypothetical protein
VNRRQTEFTYTAFYFPVTAFSDFKSIFYGLDVYRAMHGFCCLFNTWY